MVQYPTRKDNILDLMLVTSPDRCQEVDVVPGISDHDAISMTYQVKLNRNKKKPRKVYIFKSADMDSIKDDINQYRNEQLRADLEAGDTNDTWEKFKKALYDILNKHIPQRTVRDKTKLPWVNTRIRRLTRRRKRARRKAKESGRNSDWKRYHKLTKQLKQQLKEAHQEYITDIFSDSSKGINKKAWAYIKSKRKDNIGIPPLKNTDGTLCDEAHQKAEILSQQYQSVFTREDPSDIIPEPPQTLPRMPDIVIDDNGILKLLKDINIKKAVGPDLIPNRVLKECCAEVAPILGSIFRKSLFSGQLPNDWLRANVIGIYKKGPKCEASNYRPVSLTSVSCKLMEHIIYSQVMRHFSRYSFINKVQHGFLKGLSCDTQLITTTEEIQRGLDNKGQYDLIVLDFQKAFDKVPHSHLLKKLYAGGIQGKLYRWMTTYLTQRTQTVVVDGAASDEARVVSGVPQGTVLGPLMFLAYINDITLGIQGQMRLFADDALLYHPITNKEDPKSLQEDLNTLHEWSRRWKMAFNAGKCHVLHITRNRNVMRHAYNIGGTQLTAVDHHPYLGVELDNKLSWKQQVENVRSKGTRTLNMVRRNFTKGTSADTRSLIYKSLVRPVLEYGSLVWDPHQQVRIQQIEAVQNQAARFVHQDWQRTSSVTAMKETLGWLTLQNRRLVNRLIFMHKTIHGDHGYTLPTYVTKPTRQTRTNHQHTYNLVRARTDAYLYSYIPKTLQDWNTLPGSIASHSDIDIFRAHLIDATRRAVNSIVATGRIRSASEAATLF